MKILEVKDLNLGFHCENAFRQALFDVSFSLEKGHKLQAAKYILTAKTFLINP